jgi:hypothetical protein
MAMIGFLAFLSFIIVGSTNERKQRTEELINTFYKQLNRHLTQFE